MRIGKAVVTSIFLAVILFSARALAFSISVDWKGTAACFDPQSPAIRLTDVPKGTARIAFHMTDLDAPHFPHGGGTVAYSGQPSLAKGAFTYKGPCPPAPHRYHWTAEALDAAGRALARAETTLKFPP
ncbi:MAG TPA: YbhB/YbcL family Raf kinase inhibitor-like protein [Pseudolabrys sp.]|nr:YbhB/YbcL family Raf kinase inhibitor-like protein [Pseudolabrys sp.]